MRIFIIALALTLAYAAAFALDYVADTAAAVTAAPPEEEDGVVELQWDNGTRSYLMCSYTAAGILMANDFDISQMPDYTRITRILIYSSPAWPNSTWEGFRIGVYGFAGSTPTELLWGPQYVKPNLTSEGWASFSVAWTLPAGQTRFAASFEQCYDHPNADPFALDTNTTRQGHTWMYRGSWQAYNGVAGYANAMIRVRVSDAYVDIAPASIGRVKALYR